MFLVAFSLGGLLGLDLYAANPEVKFDKIVLFAPALKLHASFYLERVLSPFARLVVPSLAPESYLANKMGTPIAAYNALFEGLKQFEKHVNQRTNVPTLLFIDEQDEFIPLRALKNLVTEKKLDRWQFYIVQKDETAMQGSFHHHIIDASSTGQGVWQQMMTTAVRHLLENTSNQ